MDGTRRDTLPDGDERRPLGFPTPQHPTEKTELEEDEEDEEAVEPIIGGASSETLPPEAPPTEPETVKYIPIVVPASASATNKILHAFGAPPGTIRAILTLGILALMGASVLIAQFEGGVSSAMQASSIWGTLVGATVMTYFHKGKKDG